MKNAVALPVAVRDLSKKFYELRSQEKANRSLRGGSFSYDENHTQLLGPNVSF
jgi:hypothetical protein